MLEKFLLYIKAKKILKENDRLLLAVSGGRDSMVMLHLFSHLHWPFGVAHVNHNLRGEESDADAQMVQQYCMHRRIPYYAYTIPAGMLKKGNLQENARNIRYEWLENTALQYGYTQIATAHHQTDSIETLFIQMLRATGLAGMTGIPTQRGIIIRPMLGLSRQEIADYALTEHIEFREDQSNSEDKYLRNRIRHHLLPALDLVVPHSEQQLEQTRQHLAEAKEALDWLSTTYVNQHRIPSTHLLSLPVEPFALSPQGGYIFWYALHPFGFNRTQTDEMLSPHPGSGKHWKSKDCIAMLDRGILTITHLPADLSKTAPVEILPPMTYTFLNIVVEVSWMQPPATFSEGADVLYLDGEAFSLPLRLRNWQAGDRMKPLGMGGKSQKLQDLLTNAKLSAAQKQQTLVLESPEGILCIPGMRIAEWAKLGSQTKKVLCVTVRPAGRK
jgi:tRNA(Ile)-lysidine synthase